MPEKPVSVAEDAQPLEAVKHFVDLTQHEILALKTRFNLADAHTHQGQSPSQDNIVAELPALWYESEQKQQSYFEERFTDASSGFTNSRPHAPSVRRCYLIPPVSAPWSAPCTSSRTICPWR